MSSLNNLFNRVQMLEEAKVSPVGKQAPVFKNIPKQMKAAGLAASSRDAMIFITQVLSRLDIISPEVYEMTVKGQHKERMEKLMTILRSKEEEINAKSDEIVEYINQNLDNYTAAAGTDRNRGEKYKETAKAMSQEVQNIKAGKEADDALRDIVKTADSDLIDSLEFGAEDNTTIIEINAGNAANVENVRSAIEGMANELGVEVTGNTVEFSVDEGSQIDQMVKKNGVAGTEAFFAKHFEGEYPVTVSIIPPAGAEEKEKVAATVDALSTKPEGIEGREHLASVNAAASKFLKSRNMEDAEGKHDDGDGEEERCDYVPCEDGETVSIKGLGLNPALVRALSEDGDGSYDGTVGSLKQHINDKLALRPDIGVRGRLQQMLKQLEGQDDAGILSEKVITESKNITGDSLQDIYADVKPIVETIVESTTVNENGQTSHTQQYIVEKAEAAIEEVYTNQYLTEQKASDSLLVPKEEKSETFKERYQPKTSYQLEELRRYGL